MTTSEPLYLLVSNVEAPRESARSRTGAAAVIFIASLLSKTVLFLCFPALYGGDTVFHLRNHERLFLGHQPPMLQLLLFLTHRISTSPLAPRFLMIGISSLAAVGFFLLCTCILPSKDAFWAGFFFVTSPFLTEVSLVPFQEILMVGLLCFALYAYSKNQFVSVTLFLTFACWTRYEAWLLCPVLSLHYLWRQRLTWKSFLATIAVFGLGPISWVAFHQGLASSGGYAIEIPRSPARAMRLLYISWVSLKQTSLPLLLCALACFGYVWRNRSRFIHKIQLTASFILLYAVAIVCSAHGHGHPGMPNPEFFLNAREATLLVCFTLLAACLGFSRLMFEWHRPASLFVFGCIAIAFGLVQSWFLVRSQVKQPDIAESYQVARYLTEHVSQTERVLFVAKPFGPDDWSYYIEQVQRLGGAKSLAAAQTFLSHFDLSPMDYQRTAVQTDLPEGNLVVGADPGSVQWIAAWNNATLPPDVVRQLMKFHLAASYRCGAIEVKIWSRAS